MTNEQIDDFLAEKVMGWRRLSPAVGYRNAWIEDHATPGESIHTDYHPTTDLNQAVQAAEKVARERNEPVNLIYWPDDNTWSAGWEGEDDTLGYVSIIGPADALARAVVKATGGTDEY